MPIKRINKNGVNKLNMANYLQKDNVYVTPGWKFCSKCYKKAIETDEDLNSQEEWEPKSEKKIKLDTTIELLGISPVKLKSFSKHSKLPVAKQKFENTIDRVAKMVSLAYNIKETFLTTEIKSPILNNNINNDHDLDILMYEIKNKISETDSYCHKVQMLTLAPKSWTRKKISSYFEVSEYLVRTARKVKNENGILSLPGKKNWKPTFTRNS